MLIASTFPLVYSIFNSVHPSKYLPAEAQPFSNEPLSEQFHPLRIHTHAHTHVLIKPRARAIEPVDSAARDPHLFAPLRARRKPQAAHSCARVIVFVFRNSITRARARTSV